MGQTGRLVIITGGTGGLGKALARHYLSAGDDVVITSRDETKLRATQQELDAGKKLHVYKLDVTSNEAVRAFAAWIQIRFGYCHLLFNNAGSAVFKPFLEMRMEEINDTLRANLDGLLYVTRAFLPMLIATPGSQIVNIASLAGRVATAKATVYGASKAAVIRFSEALRYELIGTGVSVTCVLPGPIDTPFLDQADASGTYRNNVRSYLLSPDVVAKKVARGVERKKHEVALPYRLHLMSTVYGLLPEWLQRLIAPLMNRK
ncbi:SDR family NAD(P)-dependent oxidoreductase [Brevibacillus dissolubilis]|uniref:SDR family NAD(P)-dependent oxidoreductase n=1 Tax=Brevibacillus dissolubilis TaxID=1844116 RepID=UPI001116EA23|nr:SDR family NAD(P)-dependent oxidoreductase [Brevibacillus dissolubilis]